MGCWVTRAVFMSLHFFSFCSHFICSKWIQLQASNKNNHIFSGLRLINWKSLVNPVDRLLKWSKCSLKTESPKLAAPTWGAPCCAQCAYPPALGLVLPCSLRAQASLFPPPPCLLCQGDASEPDSYVRRDVREGLEVFLCSWFARILGRIEARRKITIEKIFSPEADLLKEQFPCFKELL